MEVAVDVRVGDWEVLIVGIASGITGGDFPIKVGGGYLNRLSMYSFVEEMELGPSTYCFLKGPLEEVNVFLGFPMGTCVIARHEPGTYALDLVEIFLKDFVVFAGVDGAIEKAIVCKKSDNGIRGQYVTDVIYVNEKKSTA